MDKKRISDFKTFDINPSLALLPPFGRRGKHPKKDVQITDVGTGETKFAKIEDKDSYIEGEFDYYDPHRFTKLFEGHENEIGNLPSSAIRILMFIISNLKLHSDEFRVSVELYQEALGYKSKMSVYDGLSALLSSEFIYRKTGTDGMYFVNVTKIFKGIRPKLIE